MATSSFEAELALPSSNIPLGSCRLGRHITLVIRNKWNTYLDLLQANCSEGVFSIQRRALYVAQLIKIDHQKNTACIRQVEQLIKDEAVYAAYELLECFCDFILVQLSYIRKTKFLFLWFIQSCPNDIHEAI
ncbi:hypothetical protein G4B88_027526 [Cannabis sativa]|uniref:Uncharacterized protein n=1 Tax=Cannabis sativa TaxID=3483 RepID=A0A7J6G656_CANSA|nr:hypothetical protein G4B88_027526 [Cannabis sativa]